MGVVEHVDERTDRLLIPPSSKGTAKVVMCINDREAWLRHLGSFGHQLRARQVALQFHCHLCISST